MQEILACLHDAQPSVRLKAVKSLGGMGEDGAAYMPLAGEAAALFDDTDAKVQAAAISAVGNFGEMAFPYINEIANKMNSSQKEVQQAAIAALGRLGQAAADHAPAIEKMLDAKHLDLVMDACVSLGQLKAVSSAPKLVEKMKGGDVEVTIGAIIGLSTMDQKPEEVGKMLSHKMPRVKAAALNMIVNMSNFEGFASEAVKLVDDDDSFVRIGAGNYISKTGAKAKDQVAPLSKLLGSPKPGAQAAAAMALGGIGSDAASEADALITLMKDTTEDDGTINHTKAGIIHKAMSGYRKPCCAAAYALGSLGEKASSACKELAIGLSSPDWEMRVACVTALGKMGAEGSKYESDMEALLEDSNPVVVSSTLMAYGNLAKMTSPTPTQSQKVSEYLNATSPTIRAAAASALGEMGEEAVAYLEDLVKLLSDDAWNVKMAACETVAKCGEMGEMYAADVARLMFDDSVPLRICAMNCLQKMGERGACYVDEVIELLQDPTTDVRLEALKTVAAFGDDAVTQFKYEILQVADADPLPKVREAAQPLVS